jgi:threonine/homoserine/homoserine lactone efflux protein
VVLPLHDLWLFLVAALLVNLTPGPDMLFVASTSASTGRRAGVLAALGVGLGCFVHIALAAAGLSALMATSALAFAVVKWVGSAYLVWIGLKMLLQRSSADAAPDPRVRPRSASLSPGQAFWMGAMTNALNPKVAMFFLAFLPQFIDPGAAGQAWAFVALGLCFTVSGTLVNLGVAGVAGSLSQRMVSRQSESLPGRWLRRAAGMVFVGLGVRLALTTR